MSIYPRAVFSTLYVMRCRLAMEVPTVRELGRLHFTSAELNTLERVDKKRIRDMAFQIVKKSALPVVQAGRNVTEPRIGISENGRMIFNSVISKDWVARGITKVALFFDADASKVAALGLPADGKFKGMEEADFFIAKKGDKDNQYSVAASGFLRNGNYDFAAWGSQAYDVTLNEKVGFVFGLKTGTPVKKIKQERKAKAKVVVVTPVAPPSEDELMDLD